MATQLVWFKRDLRVHDHAPLAQAARRGPCLCLYLYEPELLQSPEFDASHLEFINQSLAELDRELRARGAALVTRVGEATAVLEQLQREFAFEALWSHQETGNRITYDRDRRVAAWARRHAVVWNQLPNHGVFRRLDSRDGWARRWEALMTQPVVSAPAQVAGVAGVGSQGIRAAAALGLAASERVEAVSGGEAIAHATLESFLQQRGVNYRADMSSPVQGWNGCSRLSPYLAWGNLSIRQVVQASRRRSAELKELRARGEEIDRRWLPSLNSFSQRLHWHCHFIQKLEDEPGIEFHNMNRAFDGLREDAFDGQRFQAWCAGQTGYPMVDACMRALARGGWVNFRMRAMLVSFASHHLWLHWRPTAQYLARLFLDFEPGIHFSQMQMQAGTTGINTVRIYSPAKQVVDQDPQGLFIRRYCPELEGVPDEFLAEPQHMPAAVQRRAGCRIGKDYPAPIVDHASAYREARERIHAVKRSAEARRLAGQVYEKHGSRRRPARRTAKRERSGGADTRGVHD